MTHLQLPEQLPPERRLAEPEQMLDRILTREASGGTPRGHGRLVLGSAVAATLVVVVSALGLSGTGHPSTIPVGSPSTGSTASPASPSGGPTSPAGPAPSGDPSTVRLPPATGVIGKPVLVSNLSVQVNVASAVADQEYAIQVSTCVRALPRDTPGAKLSLTEKQWTLVTSGGTVTTDDPLRTAVPLPMTYASGRYGLGQCVTGYIPFGISKNSTVLRIQYRDPSGVVVTWDAG